MLISQTKLGGELLPERRIKLDGPLEASHETNQFCLSGLQCLYSNDNEWQVKLNVDKCKDIFFYHWRYFSTNVLPIYVMNNTVLEEVEEIKDLGVYYDSLLFDKRQWKVKKAYTMLGIIKRNFAHISRNCFVILYKPLVRSQLNMLIAYGTPKEKQTLINSRDRTGTVSGTVPARNNVGSVRSRNIFCSGAGTC